MSTTNDACIVCHQKVKGVKNIAVFDCGHKFHLSCVISRATNYNTKCPLCAETQNIKLKPNLGDDRSIAMLSSIEARIKRHRMTPKPAESFLYTILSMLTPFKSTPTSFKDYLNAGYKLSELKKMKIYHAHGKLINLVATHISMGIFRMKFCSFQIIAC